jgi:DNA repair protein RadD
MILRLYQEDAVEAAWDHLCTRSGNPVIVAPTGSGKSLMIAEMCREAVLKYKGRVIVLAHRKELLEQNAEKIRVLLPDMDIGIYSAGLRSKDTDNDIIVCGIQSVYDKSNLFGQRHLIVCDECHLIPKNGEGMYQTFLTDMRQLNPQCRLVGLTATPFRLSDGDLCSPTGMLNRVCYNIEIKSLIEQGYLSKVVSKSVDVIKDFSALHHRAGEFISNELEKLFLDKDVVIAATEEVSQLTKDRKSCLVFCCSVAHAEIVKSRLLDLACGTVEILVGDTPAMERSSLIRGFRNGEIKYLVNCEVLTTGFDAPNIDAIAVLRATESAGLFAQMVGRGMRISDNKEDCIIIDFGGNLRRHGPIDDPAYGLTRIKNNAGDAQAPVKTCPSCKAIVPISLQACPCGHEFFDPNKINHCASADGFSAVLSSEIVVQHWSVISAKVALHRGREGKKNTFRVDYGCEPLDGGAAKYQCTACGMLAEHHRVELRAGNYMTCIIQCDSCNEEVCKVPLKGNLNERIISEWVCIEHTGYALSKAVAWWKKRSVSDFPESIEDAIDLFDIGALAMSKTISTQPDGKFTKIVNHSIDEDDILQPEHWKKTEEVYIPF